MQGSLEELGEEGEEAGVAPVEPVARSAESAPQVHGEPRTNSDQPPTPVGAT